MASYDDLFNKTGDERLKDELVRHTIGEYETGDLTRREFIHYASVLGLSLSAIGAVVNVTPARAASASGAFAQAAAPRPVRGGTLAISVPLFGKLDPPTVTSAGAYVMLSQTSSWLVQVDKGIVKPMLARKWELSKNGLQWRYHLRNDVKFSNGKPLTSSDVVATFKRILDPATASPLRTLLSYIDSVVALDKYTVAFNTNRVVSDNPYHVYQKQAAILPDDWPGDFVKNPIGTGPFQITNYQAEQFMDFAPNPYFYAKGVDQKRLPYLSSLRISVLSSPTAEMAALRARQTDIMYVANLAAIEEVKAIPGVLPASFPSASMTPLHMNPKVSPWQSGYVRQAMMWLCDREQSLQAAVSNRGHVGNDHAIAPNYPVYTPEEPRKRDVAKAKALLAKAGFPRGLKVSLATVDLLGSLQFAQAFKQQAAAGGVDVEITVQPTSVYYANNIWLDVPMGADQWAHRPTPDMLISLAFACGAVWNYGGWCDRQFDQMAKAAASEIDFPTKKKLYAKVARRQSETGASVIAYWKDSLQPRQARVKNYKPSADRYDNFTDTFVSPI